MKNGNRLNRIMTLLLAVLMVTLTAVPALAAAGTESKTVRMGYFPESGMMDGAEEGAEKSGYAYEYIQELASISGWKYEYVYGSFSDLYKMLMAGEIDMLPYITYTQARTHEVLFPDSEMGAEQFYIASLSPEGLSEDLHELQGKKIGTTKDAFQNGPFNSFIGEKNITCELVEFPILAEKWDALEKGNVDYSIESSTVIQDVDAHAVCEFGERYPYYLVVAPQREDLLNELNDALTKLNDTNPEFLNNLRLRWLSAIPIFKKLPDDGAKWLESHDKIVIATYDNDAPYIIENEDGTLTGIASDQVKLALEKLGADVPVEWKLYPGREQAVAALYSGEADCINPYYHSYSDAEKDGLIISGTVYYSDFSVLYKGQYTDRTLSVVATPVTRLGASYVRDNYPESQVVPCQDGKDCIGKLNSGECTCVIMYTDALMNISSQYSENYNVKRLEADCEVCFAALPENAGLIAIFNEGYPFITDAERSDIHNKYSIEEGEISLSRFLKMNPEIIWGIIVIVVLIALVAVIIKNKADKKKEQRKQELDSYKKVVRQFTANFDVVLTVNIKDDRVRIISHHREVDEAFLGRESLADSVNSYLEKSLYPADREKVRNGIRELQNVGNQLSVGESKSLEYRSQTDDGYTWHRASLIRIGEDELLLGIKDCDGEIVNNHITKMLMDEYDGLYIVYLDRDEIRSVRSSGASEVLRFEGRQIYSKTVCGFAETVGSEYREDWLRFSDPACMRQYMADEDHREYVYELPETEKKMRRFSVDVIERADGDAVVLLLSFMGIDDLRAQTILMHRQMAEQKVLLDYFVDSFDSAYFVDLADNTYDILHMSHEYISIFGSYGTDREGMYKYIEEHVHPDDREMMLHTCDREYIKEKLKDRQSFTFVVREIFEGNEKIMRGLIVRGMDEDHIAVGFLDVTETIRKERQNQEKLEEALGLAQSASKSKTEFLFNMSHDIRTPMNAILGYTDIGIRHIDDKETVGDSLAKIRTAGGHLLNLINDILEMSRIESGTLELVENPVSIINAIRGVEQMSNSLAFDKEIDFAVNIGEIRNPYVFADELHVNEVIINLISNAVKYTPRGGRVRYNVEQIQDTEDGKARFRFEVSDNGIGMSEEFQKHLFEAFSREKNSTVSKIEGTGIGLSIVKKIVDMYSGTITVNSKAGEGSTFVVELPFRIMNDEETAKFLSEAGDGAAISNDVTLEGKRVLLVEDNEMNREIATEILEDAGLQVEAAEDGDIAVRLFYEKPADYFDFILMDIQMPVMNGYDATKAIRALPHGGSVPIIALSANAFKEDMEKSIASGMNAHVAKPIDIRTLFDVLHNLTK